MIRAAELIRRKRDGEELADGELAELVLGYARGEVPDLPPPPTTVKPSHPATARRVTASRHRAERSQPASGMPM